MPRRPVVASLADENASPGGAASVDRALSLLAAFDDQTPMLTLAALAQRTRLYKSTALRLLASLEHAQLVLRQSDGRYALGPGVARLHTVYAQSFAYAAHPSKVDTLAPPTLTKAFRRELMPQDQNDQPAGVLL
jgi:hypothetical protein